MERTRRTGSYLLPLFALLWLGMILASDLSAPLYRIDAHIRPLGSDSLVTAVGPSASRAGLRRGDVMLFSELRHLRQLGQRGTAVPVRVRRGTIVRTLMVPLTAVQQPEPVAQRVLADASISFALLLAAYLAFRRPGVMIAALILFLGGGDLSWPAFVGHFSHLPDYIYLPFAAVFSALCEWFPVMALASFAIRLPGDAPSPAQRIATRIVDAMVVIAFLISLWPQAYAMYVFFSALSGMVLMLASLTALRLARPADRGRVGIVFAGVLIGGVGYAANMVGLRLGEPFWLFTIYAEISVVVVPVALAYAILRHRVFDIAFVLNRTIVYAFTSALVVVLLGALEFIAERFLSDETHVESIVLQFGIALLVIISVRLVHRRVDVVVDSVLFRSRHEEESALRRFAATLQFYTEDVPLMRDTVDALLRYARVQGAGVYMAQDLGLRQVQSSFPVAAPSIDHNDTAYVELRAHHEPLHAHGTPTALPGDRLYPMIRAGRVVGVIATGERETGEEMPPDIDEAIKRIADAVATAAGAIESDRIRAELTSLRANFGVSESEWVSEGSPNMRKTIAFAALLAYFMPSPTLGDTVPPGMGTGCALPGVVPLARKIFGPYAVVYHTSGSNGAAQSATGKIRVLAKGTVSCMFFRTAPPPSEVLFVIVNAFTNSNDAATAFSNGMQVSKVFRHVGPVQFAEVPGRVLAYRGDEVVEVRWATATGASNTAIAPAKLEPIASVLLNGSQH